LTISPLRDGLGAAHPHPHHAIDIGLPPVGPQGAPHRRLAPVARRAGRSRRVDLAGSSRRRSKRAMPATLCYATRSIEQESIASTPSCAARPDILKKKFATARDRVSRARVCTQ
jgi:hypothetical protein